MTKDDWIPRKSDKFNAFQKGNGRPDKHNPQTCLMSHDYYMAAVDNVGNQRVFRCESWRFVKDEGEE